VSKPGRGPEVPQDPRGRALVRLWPSDGADAEALFEAVVDAIGAELVVASYGDGLTIEVARLPSEQVADVLRAAHSVDPLVRAITGGLP
jgi:hypothetical protein